jgi:Protein of unknown function (DUF2786)
MSEESHIEKIRKLLRLSKSSNQHEAELALQRAMELAAKHAVDLNALRMDGDDDIHHRWIPCGLRVSYEEKKAKSVARGFFQVTTCMSRGRYLMIGEEAAMDVAEYVIGFLVKTCRRFLSAFAKLEKGRKRRMTTTKRASFIDGFFMGVISELHDHETKLLKEYANLAIVLADGQAKRNAKLNVVVGETITTTLAKKRQNLSAATSGWLAGKKTQINPALKASDAPFALEA